MKPIHGLKVATLGLAATAVVPEPVSEVWKRPVEYHVHGVIEIGFFSVVLEWNSLVIGKGLCNFSHGFLMM